MTINWLVVGATIIAASVEWVEALTIVLAVGLHKGWRTAISATIIGAIALGLIIGIFGFAVTAYVNIVLARTIVGFFLLLFGLKWLSKAIMRYAGLKALRDEAEEYKEAEEYLETHESGRILGVDRVGFTTTFSGVFLEGLEVVFIVIALGGTSGSGSSITAASLGALIALVAVIAIGLVVRHPLTRVPENTMKFVVGVMLTAFGTFFAGEGIGIEWWHADLVILPLIGVYLLAAGILILYLRRPAPTTERRQTGAEKTLRSVGEELWGLMVGDGSIAIVALAVLFGVGFYVAKLGSSGAYAQPLFVVGVLAAVIIGISGSAVKKKPAVAAVPAQQAINRTGEAEPAARKPAENPAT